MRLGGRLLVLMNTTVSFSDRDGKPVRIPVGWITAGVAFLILWVGVLDCFHLRPRIIEPQRVWKQVEREADRVGLDAGFIYAVCWAESSLDAHARSGVARGLMQLTRGAWEETGRTRYSRAFHWQTNLRAGCDYLAFCRHFLEQHQEFSYPNLAAAYRFGPYAFQRQGFDLSAMPSPRNRIYQALFEGQMRPVPPP